MPLSIFGFKALWSPWFAMSILILIGVYFVVTILWRDKFKNSQPVTRKQIQYFLISMVLLYIIKGSPADLLGHILFSVHMAQMALLLLIVAPLLLLGIPNWIWKKVFDVKILGRVLEVFTKPVISLTVFTIMFSLNHYPMILDNVKLSMVGHALFTITLFLAALFLWWPIVNTLEGQPHLHGLKKIGYVILSAILITPACSLIIFVDHPVYETYSSGEAWLQAMALCVPAGTLSGLTISGPELFTNMPTLYDQQLGGILMKVIQELIYVFVIGKVFITWYRHEQLNADEITQRDLLERQKLSMHG